MIPAASPQGISTLLALTGSGRVMVMEVTVNIERQFLTSLTLPSLRGADKGYSETLTSPPGCRKGKLHHLRSTQGVQGL